MKEKYDINEILPKNDSWTVKRENGMFLSDHQISELKRNGIDYKKYNSTKELLMAFNEMDMDDELEEIAKQIDEKDYYSHLVN